MARVDIIVPVWVNSEESLQMTQEAIDSLEKTNGDFSLILVDDCSPAEDTIDRLISRYGDRHRVLQTLENGGSTVAVNFGIKHSTAPLIQYQNNDTYFTDPEWLNKQLALFEDQQVGVVGSKLMYADGTIQHAGACWRSQLDHAVSHIGIHEKDIKPIKDVPFVTGCGMTVRREILDSNGGGFTVYEGYGWDDIDIQIKAKKMGYKVQIAFDSTFIHHGSVSYKKRPELASGDNYVKNKKLFDDVPIAYEETIDYFRENYYITVKN